jgi:hypothetical protein
VVDFLVQFKDDQTGCTVVIDDDGRVAYAYFLASDGAVIADVWLYNRCPEPDVPEWHQSPAGPFANPKDFVRSDLSFILPDTDENFAVSWKLQDPDDPKVIVCLRDELWAIMAPGSKPGFCRLAKTDGPVAKVLPQQFQTGGPKA